MLDTRQAHLMSNVIVLKKKRSKSNIILNYFVHGFLVEAYLGRVRSGYKFDFPVPLHRISFHRTLALVNYIDVFLIAFLACMF